MTRRLKKTSGRSKLNVGEFKKNAWAQEIHLGRWQLLQLRQPTCFHYKTSTQIIKRWKDSACECTRKRYTDVCSTRIDSRSQWRRCNQASEGMDTDVSSRLVVRDLACKQNAGVLFLLLCIERSIVHLRTEATNHYRMYAGDTGGTAAPDRQA